MSSILVHVTCGPSDATRAALAFLVAKTALAEGHEVAMFLAGDGVELLRPDNLDSVQGIGTGSLRAHYDEVVGGGARLFASKMSSEARGITNFEGQPVELAPPTTLVRLAVESDRVFTY